MKFKIIESLEDEIQQVKDFYKGHNVYNTGDVPTFSDGQVKSDIFDTSTLGGFYYLRDYLADKQNIQRVTPNEYFEGCARIFGKSGIQLIKQVELDKGIIEYLKEVILKQHKKFPMPFLDFKTNQQEGMHRMYVAGELFGWNHSFPCLVVQDN